jgi:hypothetical protein
MSRQSALRGGNTTGRMGAPLAGGRGGAAIVPIASGGFYGGVRDPTGKVTEYSVCIIVYISNYHWIQHRYSG